MRPHASGSPRHGRPAPAAASRLARVSRSSWALAASLLLAVAACSFFWGALPAHTLASDIVTHVMSESHERIAFDDREWCWSGARLQLDALPGEVVFARDVLLPWPTRAAFRRAHEGGVRSR